MGLAIKISGVSKWFHPPRSLFNPWKKRPRVQTLSEINLEIPHGSLVALVGPNGAGKTTLLKILATLLLPDEGAVWVKGHHHLREPQKIREALSFAMGEERSFYWRLSARQNLEFFAALYGLSSGQTKVKMNDLTEAFKLKEMLDRPYGQLSTGMRQRVALARSFLNGASILLADEPTRSLDPLKKRELKLLIKELCRRWGKTVLFTTHDLREAEEVDLLGILHQGQLLAVGRPEELQKAGGRANLEEVFADLCNAS